MRLMDTGNNVHQIGAHQRLATGKADLLNAQFSNRNIGKARDLLGGEQILLREPLQTIRRHAINATKITFIGQRDTQIRRHATPTVQERTAVRNIREFTLGLYATLRFWGVTKAAPLPSAEDKVLNIGPAMSSEEAEFAVYAM